MPRYYDEKIVHPLVVEYLSSADKNSPTSQLLATKIMTEVSKVVKGIIFTHRYTSFEDYDDLFQTASLACWKALNKFDPLYVSKSTGQRATTFNYFSLTAKRCLLFDTLRDKKNRDCHDMSGYQAWFSHDVGIVEAVETIIDQVASIYIQDSKKSFRRLARVFCRYLRESGSFHKREFFIYAKSYGTTSNLIRAFISDLRSHRELFDGVEIGRVVEYNSVDPGSA
jgi:hypothetical protein